MDSELERVHATLGALPIFPLPQAVLLPFEVLPLHVFEPRYREMMESVLDGDRVLAIARVRTGHEGELAGRPPVEPLCGAGVIVRQERLSEGRCNVLVRGVRRVRIAEELPARRGWREVRAVPVEDVYPPGGPAQLEGDVDTLREALLAFCTVKPGPASNALAHLAANANTPGMLADLVAAALLTDFPLRHRFLVTTDVAERLELLRPAVAELLATHKPAPDQRFRN